MAENRNGDLWALQAREYDPKYRVRKKDVDKFLSGSGRKVFTHRMLIATTGLIDRAIQQREKRGSLFRLNKLRAAAVDGPALPDPKVLPARSSSCKPARRTHGNELRG